MALKIGTNNAKKAYFGTSTVKHIYLGTTLVYSDTLQLYVAIGTGVSSAFISWTTVNGKTSSASLVSSGYISIPYGSTVSISASAKTGYNLNSYTQNIVLTANSSISITGALKTYSVVFSKGTGVSYLSVKSTTAAGAVTNATYYSSTSVSFTHGTTLAITPVASIGYTLNSFTSSHTVISSTTLSYSATINSYSVDVNLNYGGTQYGLSYGDKIGTFYYSTDGTNYYGPYSNEPWDTSKRFTYGSKLYIKSIGSAPGFAFSSVAYNGASISGSSGVYTITIGAGNYSLDINYISTTISSSTSFGYASSITTNTLSRSAFNVSMNINVQLTSCSAGTVIGTIPYQYRPSSAKTFTTNWAHTIISGSSSSDTWSQATITINTNGTIVSNTDSVGTTSSSGGGKWGGYSLSTTTHMTISGSWSVI